MSVADNAILSVIIPTKNRPHLLSRALKSVAEQDFPYFEVCVIDNNPDPIVSSQVKKTVEGFKSQYSNHRWIYIHSNKAYASGARNDGIDATTGKYIIFLDDDDELLENSIKLRVNEMDSDPNLALLYCAAYSKIYPYPFKMYRYYHYNKRFHKDKLMMMSCSSIMINREIFNSNNLRFDELQSRMDDYDLCRRVIQLDLKVKSIPIPLVNIYLHPETRISSHRLINYDFKDVLIERWSNSAAEVVYDYAEGVYIWRKCFGIETQTYTEITQSLKKTFNKRPTLGFKIKFFLVSLSPNVYLGLYHLAVSCSQLIKNTRAQVNEQD